MVEGQFLKGKKEAFLFSVCATVASGYAEERTDPGQLRSSKSAKGSKMPPQGIYCPPAAMMNCANQTSVALRLLWFCRRLEVTPPVLTVTKFKPKCRFGAKVGKVYYALK